MVSLFNSAVDVVKSSGVVESLASSFEDAKNGAGIFAESVGGAGSAASGAAGGVNELDKALTEFTDNINTEYARIQESTGGAVAAVEAWYTTQKQRLSELGLAYTDYATKLEVIFNDKMAAAYKTDLENATDWRSGIERAVAGLSESIGNESDLAEAALTSVFNNAATAISNFAKTGKLDFKEFARSVAADILMMTTKMLLLKALKGIFGAGFAEGGQVGGATGFATGGFVSGAGSATSDSIPAMLSNGEYVINAKATEQFLPLLAAINSGRGIMMAGGGMSSEGGSLAAPPQPVSRTAPQSSDEAKGAAGGGQSLTINNYVTSKAVAESLDSPEGDIVVMNIIERNRNTVKGLVQ